MKLDLLLLAAVMTGLVSASCPGKPSEYTENWTGGGCDWWPTGGGTGTCWNACSLQAANHR